MTILDVINTDSIATTSYFRGLFEELSPMRYAFWLSVLFVVIISALKYSVCTSAGTKDLVKFSLELPIDVCALLLTLILSFFISQENLSFGFILFGISFIFIIIICIIRNKANSCYDSDRSAPTYWLLTLEFLIAFLWLCVVYNEMP